MNNQRQIEENVQKLVDSGKVEFIDKLCGKKLCCSDPKNIVIEPMATPNGLDIRNPEHFDKLKKMSKKAHCKFCGTKYWLTADRKTLIHRE